MPADDCVHRAMVVSGDRRTVLAKLFADARSQLGKADLIVSRVSVVQDPASGSLLATADFRLRTPRVKAAAR